MSTRISTNQLYSTATSHVNDARTREQSSSEKAATMKEINRPSDNPSNWTQANLIKDDLKNGETILKNMAFANRMLQVSDNLLAQITDGLQKTHELSISAASDGAGGPQGRKVILPEVRAQYDNLIRVLNTKFAGRTLLGGFQTQNPAYSHEGEHLGDDGKMEIEVGNGVKMALNLNAKEVIHGEGVSNGIDILGTMRNLVEGLENDNIDSVRNALPALMTAIDQISMGRSTLAARMNELDKVREGTLAAEVNNKEAASNLEDVDSVKAISDLTRDQAVLRAAMSTSQKILSEDPSSILFR